MFSLIPTITVIDKSYLLRNMCYCNVYTIQITKHFFIFA